MRVHHIDIPALNARREDIPLLIDCFLEQEALKQNKKKPTPPKELYTLLGSYDFPGNVRELRHMIADAVSEHKSKMLSLEVFKARMTQQSAHRCPENGSLDGTAMIVFPGQLPTRNQALILLIDEAINRAGGNQTIAARMLNMSQQAISKHLKARPK